MPEVSEHSEGHVRGWHGDTLELDVYLAVIRELAETIKDLELVKTGKSR